MSDALADLREAGSGLSGTTPSPRRRGTRMGSARFGGTFGDPPTQGELEAFAAYVETLRAALVR